MKRLGMDCLKGHGREILYVERDSVRISLMEYIDGSWGIRRGSKTFCVWEPSEAEDCARTFAIIAGVGPMTLSLLSGTAAPSDRMRLHTASGSSAYN